MAFGRKRLVVGTGFVACGAVVAVVMLVSRWYSVTFDAPSRWFLNVREGYVGWVCGSSSFSGFSPILAGTSTQSSMTFEPVHRPKLVWWWDFPGGRDIIDIGIFRHVGSLDSASLAFWPSGYSGRFCLWPIALAPALLGSAIIVSRRWWRHKPGHCLACGYDLRGLATGTGCPECGKAIRARSASEGESAKV